jgi:hypothetical protein
MWGAHFSFFSTVETKIAPVMAYKTNFYFKVLSAIEMRRWLKISFIRPHKSRVT